MLYLHSTLVILQYSISTFHSSCMYIYIPLWLYYNSAMYVFATSRFESTVHSGYITIQCFFHSVSFPSKSTFHSGYITIEYFQINRSLRFTSTFHSGYITIFTHTPDMIVFIIIYIPLWLYYNSVLGRVRYRCRYLHSTLVILQLSHSNNKFTNRKNLHSTLVILQCSSPDKSRYCFAYLHSTLVILQ